jgi:hypothetical protein
LRLGEPSARVFPLPYWSTLPLSRPAGTIITIRTV